MVTSFLDSSSRKDEQKFCSLSTSTLYLKLQVRVNCQPGRQADWLGLGLGLGLGAGLCQLKNSP